MRIKGFLLFTASLCAFLSPALEPNQTMLQKVKMGEIKEAKASWWGFDATDATKYLQDAINSKVPKLVIDKMANTWNVTPLRLVSNQEIIFEEGARIAAKRGAFQMKGETLFTLKAVTNVTIRGKNTEVRMYRDDYAANPYDFSVIGTRDTFLIIGSKNITIDGLNLVQSGGNGFAINDLGGKRKLYSENITIRNCKITKSCRRGISIAGAKDVTIDSVEISDVAGNWPESGIALRTDDANHRLENISIINTRVSQTKGYGLEMSINGDYGEKTLPITATISKSTFTANDCGFHYSGSSPKQQFPKGIIVFSETVIEKARRHGIKFYQKPLASIRFRFDNCKLIECSQNGINNYTDIDLAAGRNIDPPVDGIAFNNLEIRQQHGKREWISKLEGNWVADDVKEITGKVRIFSTSAKKEITLDTLWRKASFPQKSKGVTPQKVAFTGNINEAVITDFAKGKSVPLSTIITKNRARYAFCVEKARTVKIKARYIPYNKKRSSTPIIVRKYGEEKVIAKADLPDFYENGSPDGTISFDLPAPGFYSMEVKQGYNGLLLTEADVPIAIDVTEGAQVCQGSECRVFFPPLRGKPFAAFVCGNVAFDICNASGVSQLKVEGLRDWSRYYGSAWAPKDIWSIKVAKTKNGGLGEYQIDLYGMQGFFFLSDKKFWRGK